MKKRYGIDDDELLLREIGKKHDLSRERVRQIESESITKLKLNTSLQALAAEVE